MQKPKPAAPVRPIHSPKQQPRPLPTIQPMQPKPLQPAPKATGSRYKAELTDAELADYARRIVALDTEIARLLAKIAELRRQEAQAINDIRLGTNPGIIEVCSLCGLAHEGSCNA